MILKILYYFFLTYDIQRMKKPFYYNFITITTLDISNKELTELPSWISTLINLKKLYCFFNKITHLDNLPQTLEILSCYFNYTMQLDNLPTSLKELYC